MRVVYMMILTLFLSVLVGCQGDQERVLNHGEEPLENEPKMLDSPMEPEESDLIYKHSDELSEVFRGLYAQTQNGQSLEMNIKDEEWVKATIEMAIRIQQISEEAFQYEVPTTYSDSYPAYLEQMDFYKVSMEELMHGLKNKDVNAVDEVLRELQ